MRTLVDCPCETKVHKDGSGVEVYMCALHGSAPLLLEALQAMTHLMQEAADEIDTDPKHPLRGYGGKTVRENIFAARAAISAATSTPEREQ